MRKRKKKKGKKKRKKKKREKRKKRGRKRRGKKKERKKGKKNDNYKELQAPKAKGLGPLRTGKGPLKGDQKIERKEKGKIVE